MSDIDRRRLLSASALGAAGLALPGCATTRVAAPARSACLPRVHVAADRIIRTLVGLRPFRPQGFRVEREALGDTALVHNYGHGGAGWTLAWGTARLAIELGLPGHRGPVAVLGAGIAGLATARLLQEAGYAVTVYAAALPPETVSNIAGGQIHAYGHADEEAMTPAYRAQFDRAADFAWRRLQIMVGDDYGVRWLPTYVEGGRAGPHTPGFRRLSAAETPFAVANVAVYETMYVEPGRFLRMLAQDIRQAGGRILVRRFATAGEIAALPERLVFNCTGLGAGTLFGDRTLTPIRGQLAMLLPQPEVRYAYNGSAGYMFPRADGILLGGSYERHVGEAVVEPQRVARIIANHQQLNAGMRCK